MSNDYPDFNQHQRHIFNYIDSIINPFTDDDRLFMQECDIYPRFDGGEENGAVILTEDSEGAVLSREDLIKLSLILFKYATRFDE